MVGLVEIFRSIYHLYRNNRCKITTRSHTRDKEENVNVYVYIYVYIEREKGEIERERGDID